MSPSDRLRIHPEERLAAPVQRIDLAASARQLRSEAHAPVSGHRQIAVYRHGPVTLLHFVFDQGGIMKEHSAEGVVTIRGLSGHLVVVAEEDHELCSGDVLGQVPASTQPDVTIVLTMQDQGGTGN